jgi:DNA-binding NtrC family response regulator
MGYGSFPVKGTNVSRASAVEASLSCICSPDLEAPEYVCNSQRPMKILVIDDEAVVLESCRKILSSEGFEVVLVPTVDDALAVLDQARFALLLIDIKMPERDGLSLMDVLKGRGEQIPILVMSGYHTDETVEEARRRGAAAFIPKPFTPDELLGAVQGAIGKEQAIEHHTSPRDR